MSCVGRVLLCVACILEQRSDPQVSGTWSQLIKESDALQSICRRFAGKKEKTPWEMLSSGSGEEGRTRDKAGETTMLNDHV